MQLTKKYVITIIRIREINKNMTFSNTQLTKNMISQLFL